MESKKVKSRLTRNEKRRRKRSGHRDPNPEVEGHTADIQDQEAESQEVEEGLIAEEGGRTVEEEVLMTGDHLAGDHLPHIIGQSILFLYSIDIV